MKSTAILPFSTIATTFIPNYNKIIVDVIAKECYFIKKYQVLKLLNVLMSQKKVLENMSLENEI